MSGVGKLFVIMGPSGVGKTTLVNALIASKGCESITRVATYTTRKKRPGEVDGVDYLFITEKEFQEKIKAGKLLEWSRAYRSFYGLGKKNVEDALAAGKTVLAVVDRLGAMQIKKIKPEVQVVLIVPPSREELRARLEKRSSESSQNVDFRMQQAVQEDEQEQQNRLADQIVVNDTFEIALENLKKIICV